jgi:glycosyltransferase involved in cell wall biosynthesis
VPEISAVICTHNPRRDYLERALHALEAQSLPKHRWELLVVDNASHRPLAELYDLSWHPKARHVREDLLGLTPARLHGITQSRGHLLVFVDDDNVLAPDYLEEVLTIHEQYPALGTFGSGRLTPEFEIEPPVEIRKHFHMYALRTVSSTRWSNNPMDSASIPCGAGLCVCRPVAVLYRQFVEGLALAEILDRRGRQLLSGGDDLFSWVAASAGYGFGIFPRLSVTHLMSAERMNHTYLLKLLHDHRFSHGVLNYVLAGIQPRRIDWFTYVHLALHGARNGRASMRRHWAQSRGEDRAARFISTKALPTLEEFAGSLDVLVPTTSR